MVFGVIVLVAVAAVVILFVKVPGAYVENRSTSSTTQNGTSSKSSALPPVSGKIWEVPQNYQTIDSAITVASPGDEILISSGTYQGFTVDKAVQVVGSLQGTTKIGGPVIVTTSGARVYYVSAASGISVTGNNDVISNDTVGYTAGVQQTSTISIQGGNNVVSYNVVNQGSSSFLACLGPTCYNPWVSIQGSGNTVRGNLITGVSGSSFGIETSSGNTLTGNEVICAGSAYGIGLSVPFGSSNSNTVTDNEVQDCGVGIYVTGSSNTVAGNNFIDNGVQAEDDGSGNSWSANGQGNYWSDWSKPNLPYPISGTARSSDPHPLTSPITVLVIVTTANFNVITACAGVQQNLNISSISYSPIGGNVSITFVNQNSYSILWWKVGLSSGSTSSVNKTIPGNKITTISLSGVASLTVSGGSESQLNGTAWELYLELRPTNTYFPDNYACTKYPKAIAIYGGVAATVSGFSAAYFGPGNTGNTFECLSPAQAPASGAMITLTNKGTNSENVTYVHIQVPLSSTSVAVYAYFPSGTCLVGTEGTGSQSVVLYFPNPVQFPYSVQAGQKFGLDVAFSDGTRATYSGTFG
jgi:parallel beta-helix repeat protein